MPHRKNDGVHDETGNRVRRARGGASSVRETPFSATYDAGNRMLTFNTDTLAYDAAGNLVRRTGTCGTTTYTWDARNQLTQIQGFTPDCTPVTGAFIYDDRGRRIEKTVNGRSVRYLYDGPQVIAELAGAMIDTTYLTGLEIDEVLARYGAQSERMLLADALGSVLALTDPQGNPTTTYAYSAYGKTEQAGAPSENPVQYTGRENDNTGLYYYRARYYAPELARFISGDPIGLEGGLNMYAYVLNNPLRWRDPRGFAPEGNWDGEEIGSPRYTTDFGGGTDDFRRNFSDMNTTHIPGADKYFHCKANCQAARRGTGGEHAACLLSNMKEGKDGTKRVRLD